MLISNISVIGWLHTIACLIALATGAYVLAACKGTRSHRMLGYWYVGAMVVLNLSVMAIYRFDIWPGRPPAAGPGIFGFFHYGALVTLASVTLAIFAASRQRHAGWAHIHAQAMLGSYYGLVGGLINEMFARILPLRALAMHMSPHASNVTRTALVGLTQQAAMLLWFALAMVFFRQVAARYDRRSSVNFTIGYPMRYSGGAFLVCVGSAISLGALYRGGADLGWCFVAGALLGICALIRVRRAAAPFWGLPSRRQTRVMQLAVGLEVGLLFLLGGTGFFQTVPRLVSWETTLAIVGAHFLIMRASHGPTMTWLGLSVLSWLGIGILLHLPLPLIALCDGLLKLGFGFAMMEPLLLAGHSSSRARMSDGVAPDSRKLPSVTA